MVKIRNFRPLQAQDGGSMDKATESKGAKRLSNRRLSFALHPIRLEEMRCG